MYHNFHEGYTTILKNRPVYPETMYREIIYANKKTKICRNMSTFIFTLPKNGKFIFKKKNRKDIIGFITV